MEVQQNMANVIRLIMETRNMSMDDFSEELEISRSTLQEYLKGKGNPSIKTIIHLSQKLEIEPAVLLTGMTEVEARNVVRPLLNAVRSISELNNDKKLRLAELFWEMVRLWADE